VKTVKPPFALAGIWDNWFNLETQAEVKSFSIITTKANSLLEKIHNTQKRMPVILSSEDERDWLQSELAGESVQAMLRQYNSEEMEAYPVSRIVREVVLKQAYPDPCKL
jgi:putative SOS response-associated peptidase YedK